ncbi:sphinganine C4-monooxygenase 1-like [Wolffia australiana]
METCVCRLRMEIRAALIPFVVYWVYSALYMALDYGGKFNFRRRPDDEDKKNLASKRQVFFGVLIHQAFQAALTLYLFKIVAGGCSTSSSQPFVFIMGRLAAAMVVMDTWQYFLHRFMHSNALLYRYSHAKHHRLVAPYAFGALYYHTPEGLLLNTVGGFVAMAAARLPPCASVLFFSLVNVRTIDIHCGMWLPRHPLNRLFGNNAAFHELHHRQGGGEFNFSQPFFVFWDKILGTHMPYAVEEEEGGGFHVKPAKA